MPNQEDNHRKRRPRAGDMAALQRILWRAILISEEVLMAAQTPEVRLKAANTIAQSSAYYTRLVETVRLLERVEALEAAVRQGVRS
jgi:hypothetical protein